MTFNDNHRRERENRHESGHNSMFEHIRNNDRSNRRDHEHSNRHDHRHEHDPCNRHDHRHDENRHAAINCPLAVGEEIDITVPVSIRAHADVDEMVLRCAGHSITKESNGRHGRRDRKIKIKQRIELCIPIKFKVECDVHREEVEFGENDA